MTEVGEKILKLHAQGKSYNEIHKLLGCSKATISYWCNQKVRQATKRRFHDRRNRNIKLIQEVKSSKPCADCGRRFPYYVMQFDHLPEYDKSFTISEAKTNVVPLEKLKEEIAKCDVVCANCHAIRTYRRKNGGLS